MSSNVPGLSIHGRDDADPEFESWRGVDDETGEKVTVRRIRGAAGRLDEVTWRSAALSAIGCPGLLMPRAIVRHDGDLVVVYDETRPLRASGGSPARVAAVIGAAARQLHALHAAGMTHGGIGAGTVRRDAVGEPVVIGTAESGLRAGAADDTAAGDVRSLAALGLRLLRRADDRRPGVGERALLAILNRAAQPQPGGADPCDPAPCADLAQRCASYVADEPVHAAPARSGARVRGDYVARHRRSSGRRWPPIRLSRMRRSSGRRTGHMARRHPSVAVRGPAVACAVVVVLVAVCAWMGTVWGDDARRSPVSADAGLAAQSAGPPTPAATSSGIDAHAASPQQWVDYLGTLYALRSTAFIDLKGDLLDQVYTSDSPQRDADLSAIAALADSGARVAGFAPEILAVQDVSDLGDVVVVRVLDRVPPYTVVDATGTPTAQPGRDSQPVSVTLTHSGVAWLITTAVRMG